MVESNKMQTRFEGKLWWVSCGGVHRKPKLLLTCCSCWSVVFLYSFLILQAWPGNHYPHPEIMTITLLWKHNNYILDYHYITIFTCMLIGWELCCICNWSMVLMPTVFRLHSVHNIASRKWRKHKKSHFSNGSKIYSWFGGHVAFFSVVKHWFLFKKLFLYSF